MPKTTTRGRNQDRTKVAGGQDHEVKYEAGKTGASKVEVKSAVNTYWNHSFGGGYDKSSGLRMDHLLVSPSLSPKLRGAGVDVETRGWEKRAITRRHG